MIHTSSTNNCHECRSSIEKAMHFDVCYTLIHAHFVKLCSILKKGIAVFSALMAVFHVLQFKLKMNSKIEMVIISSLSKLE